MKYRAIASDLDGTLFNKEMRVSEENLEAIEEISKLGVEFVPTTGRTLAEISADLLENPNIRYIIYSNGSGIWDKKKNEHTYACMSKPLASTILDILASYEVHITVRANGKTFVNAKTQNEEMREYNRVSYYHGLVLDSHAERVDDFGTFLRSLDAVEVFSVFFHSDEEYAKCREVLSEISEVSFVTTLAHNYEIFSAKSGKANAIGALAALLGATTDEIISVGDSHNDMSMIRAAGLGLATANAKEDLKRVAKGVICSNDEHIAKFILENIL
jgi:Cof subfamily protein (haloacid dehalogenase superfamily)